MKKINLFFILLTGFHQTIFASTVNVKKDGDIRADPSNSATVVSTIKNADKVLILGRKGFWVEVKFGNSKGWTKISNLDIKDDNNSGTSDGLSVLSGLASGRVGTGNIVSAAGTRGLDGDQIKAAKNDEVQFKNLTNSRVRPEEATSFAKAAGLYSRNISYLEPPVANSTAQPVSNN